MSALSIVFAPLIPWQVLAGLAAASLLVLALGVWRRASGVTWRAAFLALLLLALANPVLTQEERQPLDDVALVVVDRSPSQGLGARPERLDAAVEHLRERAAGIGGLELREVNVLGEGTGGTRAFGALAQALAEVDRTRLSGIIVVTDGQIHDAPETFESGAPLHLLLTGDRDESDRNLIVETAPAYGMVGEEQTLTLRVDDDPDRSVPVPVVVRQDGEVVHRTSAVPGETLTVPFEMQRAGRTVIEVEAEVRAGELTAQNNRVVAFVNGVRDRLRVLLVSGQPYPGLRVWRNLLKADPAVDLVHFTILRPPEKQDGTPIRELALIAFPSRELFEVKLDEFDLVIFDRYSRRGLLPLAYLENVARYVEKGGALLEAAGPEFAHPLSLFRTPLARVLPGRPSGIVYERGFRPALTDLGYRHPVTAGLAGAESEEPDWGRWFRQIDVETDEAQILMSGVSDRPLLVLARVGEGRVAQLLSDHAWLWARGFEGGGPQSLILRRLVHWLMKEPELEEELLLAEPKRGSIEVSRRSLEPGPVDVTLTAPSGRTTELALEVGEDGEPRGMIEVDEAGLYRVSDGDLVAYAAVDQMSPKELADIRSTPDLLQPLVEASGGTVAWLGETGVPELRKISPGRSTFGRGWIGLHDNQRYLVTGAAEMPLLPAILALALLLGTIALAWYREGRT